MEVSDQFHDPISLTCFKKPRDTLWKMLGGFEGWFGPVALRKSSSYRDYNPDVQSVSGFFSD
jgi:hypothetical protein